MGIDAVNIQPRLHGYGTSGSQISVEIRIHFGDESIDETHDIGTNAWRTLMQKSLDNNETGFKNNFGVWFDAVASSGAAAFRSDFLTAAWRAFP